MSGPPPSWAAGRCGRGHDITDPANVRTVRRAARTQLECRECIRVRTRAARAGIPLPPSAAAVTFPPRECEWCGTVYTHDGLDLCRKQWNRRRYCGATCQRAAFGALRKRNPLDAATLARLRAAVGAAT